MFWDWSWILFSTLFLKYQVKLLLNFTIVHVTYKLFFKHVNRQWVSWSSEHTNTYTVDPPSNVSERKLALVQCIILAFPTKHPVSYISPFKVFLNWVASEKHQWGFHCTRIYKVHCECISTFKTLCNKVTYMKYKFHANINLTIQTGFSLKAGSRGLTQLNNVEVLWSKFQIIHKRQIWKLLQSKEQTCGHKSSTGLMQ